MVKGIIESCQKYSTRVIGEGAETKEELHTLISLGVDFVQGYFLQKTDPEMNDCDQARCAFCSALTRNGMTIRSMTIAGAVETKYAVIQTLKE